MKKLLRHIIIFLLPVFLVWFATELFYRTTPNNFTYKNKQLKAYYDTAETIVFGDSHAFYGVNPEYLDTTTFNASNISQSLYFDKLLFERHIDSFKTIKQILITVAYTTLSEEDNKLDLVTRKYFYQNQMDLDVPLISAFNPRKYSLALSRSFRKTADLIGEYYEKGTLVTSHPNGFLTTNTIERSSNDLDRVAKIVTKRHEDNLLDFGKNTKRLQSIINACKQRDIKVCLVSFPVNYRYVKLVNSDKVDKMYATCNILAKENENVTYINLFEDNRFRDEDFYDANHLNVKGAEKCSKILNVLLQESK